MVRCGFEDDPEFLETVPVGQLPTLTGMRPHVQLIRQASGRCSDERGQTLP
jgi:hypothetical protein